MSFWFIIRTMSTTNRYPHIDYDHAPASYWDNDNGSPLETLLRNVQGTQRRAMIIKAWEENDLENIPPALLQAGLSELLREEMGRIHPAFMGGEYLPEYEDGEVEIARIELKSTTGDVTSIRARPGDLSQGEPPIVYRVEDEYQTEFTLARAGSDKPLTLAELIDFIDDTASDGDEDCHGLALQATAMNFSCGSDAESLLGFATVTSDFYPDLEAHYDAFITEWLEEAAAEEEDGEPS